MLYISASNIFIQISKVWNLYLNLTRLYRTKLKL
jgi:hypothetical protein